MKAKLTILFSAVVAFAAPALAQSELVLGYLTAETGPFVSLSRTNEIAARIAVETRTSKARRRSSNSARSPYRLNR